MSKIIIHNESTLPDSTAIQLVQNVMREGFTSGDRQYCWLTCFTLSGSSKVSVHSLKTRGSTHTFKVRDAHED